MLRFNAILAGTLLTLLTANFAKATNNAVLPPTVASLEKFARNIEASIANGNPSYINNVFDIDVFFQKVSVLLTLDQSKLFKAGFENGLKESLDLGSLLVNEIGSEGTYSFLRAYHKSESGRMLFRLYSNAGINYHEFEVMEVDGELKIVDVYVFMTAEPISETIARVYKSYNGPGLNALSDIANTAKITEKYNEIETLALSGSNCKAYKKLNKEQALRQYTIFQILGIHIATSLDNEIFWKEYTQFVKTFPEVAGKYLVPLDGLMKHGFHNEALVCIDSLEKSIGGDPMMALYKANIYYGMKDFAHAINCLRVFIGAFPENGMGYLSLLGIFIENGQYSDATHLLDKMSSTFNQYKEDFQPLLAQFPSFLKSEEFQNWINQ